ncbi:MAG: hypothetical protein R6V18_08745 [Desulfuromonadaceae bacterium]
MLKLIAQLRATDVFLVALALLLMMLPQAVSAHTFELPQRHTYQLSCLFIPAAGRIDLELNPHPSDSEKMEARVDVTFEGLVGSLSRARVQHYVSTLVMNPDTSVTGVHHRQEVEVDHGGERIHYAWEWLRNADEDSFLARRFWGGEQKQLTTLKGGADVVSDILSLILRIGAVVHSHQPPAGRREYTLLDPEGNIRVQAHFISVENTEPAQTRVRLDFSRSPLTLGTSRLELWFNSAGDIMRGRVAGAGGLFPLNFTPVEE